MIYRVGWITLALLPLAVLTACSTSPSLPIPFVKPADEVRFGRVEVALALGDMSALVAVLESKAQERCADTAPPAKRFSSSSCQQIQAAIDQAAALKATIEKALRNPKVEIDWAEVARVVKLLVGIAMKFV